MSWNCELFMVTFRRDFVYLEWCLKSIQKFTLGFSGTRYGRHGCVFSIHHDEHGVTAN